MTEPPDGGKQAPAAPAGVIDLAALDALLATLAGRGYTLIAPTLRQGAIVYGEVHGVSELPAGWGDVQDAGSYRLRERGDGALFGHNVGPNSWKDHLFPPVLSLWKASRGADGAMEVREQRDDRRFAFIGVRSCDLHAVAVQDRVFTAGPHVDGDYAARRQDAFIVAVNCAQSASTCFCCSMGTGPRAEAGYDIALTELLDGGPHRFLAEVGSERGGELLAELPGRAAQADDELRAQAAIERASDQQRTLDTTDIRDLLARNLEHPRWDEVAERCLSCGNCTMVCPTCFCSSVEDVTDLAGSETERVRSWDSCFSLEHSHLHGGSVRASGRARYRQWMTHKLGTWIDQFGSSGCVGCGRCIAWCPVAIDITEEAAAIRATDGEGDGGAQCGRQP